MIESELIQLKKERGEKLASLFNNNIPFNQWDENELKKQISKIYNVNKTIDVLKQLLEINFTNKIWIIYNSNLFYKNKNSYFFYNGKVVKAKLKSKRNTKLSISDIAFKHFVYNDNEYTYYFEKSIECSAKDLIDIQNLVTEKIYLEQKITHNKNYQN